MSTLTFAINEVKNRIPEKILSYAFQNNVARIPNGMESLDSRISDAVIWRRVMPTLNLVGGKEVKVPLHLCEVQPLTPYGTVYHIPGSLTQNRQVVQVYEVEYGATNGYGDGYGGPSYGNSLRSSPMSRATRGIVDAATGPMNAATSDVAIVAPNTVVVNSGVLWGGTMFLRCRVANDDDLSSIQPQTYRQFAETVVAAVQAYIYNTCMISVDEGLLQGGQQLGAFRDILSNYSDAEEKFQELVDEWRPISMLNDPATRRRFQAIKIRKF